MNIAQTVFETLRQEYDSGMTQEEVAAKHHVRHSQMQPILSGKRSAGGLRIETLDRMFPNATINLNGNGNNTITQVASNVKVNTQSINSGAAPGSVEQARSRIIAALIPLDIPPESLQAVLRTINELDLN
ncbi:MAG: hypothetical protein IJT68_06400 [Lentisphaeria bacterium]|nr:hypothetical protein [Lentisphaeria bacterium]